MSISYWSGEASVKGKQLDLWPELEHEWQMRHAYPRWRFITDYRPVLGLSLRGHLRVESVDLVRFDYLRAHARIDGESIERVLRQVVPDYGQVEEVQAAWDNRRRRLASVDQALQRVIHRLEAAEGYVEQAPSRRVFFEGVDTLLGWRWGHEVLVTCDRSDACSLVAVGVDSPHFELRGRRGRLVALGQAPPRVRALVYAVGIGPWEDVRVWGQYGGIFVERPGRTPFKPRWPYDLWLAEHLAAALAGQP